MLGGGGFLGLSWSLRAVRRPGGSGAAVSLLSAQQALAAASARLGRPYGGGGTSDSGWGGYRGWCGVPGRAAWG